MLGCIISNCGTQASKTVYQQISTHFLQSTLFPALLTSTIIICPARTLTGLQA